MPGAPLDLDSEWSTSRSVRMKSNNTWRGETNLRIPDAGVYSYSTRWKMVVSIAVLVVAVQLEWRGFPICVVLAFVKGYIKLFII